MGKGEMEREVSGIFAVTHLPQIRILARVRHTVRDGMSPYLSSAPSFVLL